MTVLQLKKSIQGNLLRMDESLVTRAAPIPCATLSDAMKGRGTLNSRIKALSSHMRVCGPALTVETAAGDNLMFHAALAQARPGDVIVVDGHGYQDRAICGEIMATQAKALGVAGFIVDAAVRDVQILAKGDFPVFSIGTHPLGPTKSGQGRINFPVTVGGIIVYPGDLIVGDADGVVAIGHDDIEHVLKLAITKLKNEEQRIKAIHNGEPIAPWLKAHLNKLGLLRFDAER